MAVRRFADPRFAARLRELLEQRGMSYRSLAGRTYYSKSYLHDLAHGRKIPTPEAARRLDDALAAGGELAGLITRMPPSIADEIDAVELARRIDASDVGNETVRQLEQVFDRLAMAYATSPPEALLPRIRQHLGYVRGLLDARKTLLQHRQLLVIAGWLSLLGATVHIDLRQHSAAYARLNTASQLAGHSEHAEILAWCLETQAWDVLTAGDYVRAVDLSRQAQAIAPRGGSAHIQATAQEGRAWARMGQRAESRYALDRVARLVSSLAVPEQPEHHYRYDPGKALAYIATTLAWAGDPAAEEYARTVISQLEAANGVARPRRVASARLDLSLALLAGGKPDEASAVAIQAIASGRIVPSNWWRATEVMAKVEDTGIREATELREVYEAHRP